MDIKDIIELSKNGFTPADIKDLITTMNEQKQGIAQEANNENRDFPEEPAAAGSGSAAAGSGSAAAEPETAAADNKTQELIDAIKDLKKSIQASNIRKDNGAPQAQSVEDVLASLVK